MRPTDAGRESADSPEAQGQRETEVTVPQALSIAMFLQQNEQFDAAETTLRAILDVVPDHPAAMHYFGLLLHQRGRTDEGIDWMERSVAREPNQADWHSNLGIALRSAQRVDEAMTAYRRAIAIDASHANAHNNLGVLLKARGFMAEAESALRTAIRLNPSSADAYTNLGTLLAATGRVVEGIECFNRATVLCPQTKEARLLQGLAHCELGERDKAVAIFREWLDEEPDDPVAQHMLAACSGEHVPERASDGYVRKTFDKFAATFDDKLTRLAYRAPQLIGAMLEDAGIFGGASLDVLDAGCGTGLCGALLRPCARRLVGVDLSDAMLRQAEKRTLYDELVCQELTEYMTDRRGCFDVIVSGDTLVYIGALDTVLHAAARALRPGGMFVFTLEAAGEIQTDYLLHTHGRYAHARAYVEAQLAAAGFVFDILPAELRMESGRPVAGYAIRAIASNAQNDATGAAHG